MPELKDFRIVTYNLAANGAEDIRASGTYIVVLSATGAFQLGRDNGPPFVFFSGLKLKLPEGEQFDSLQIVDTSGAANTVQLAIGFGDFDDNRLTVSGAIDVSKSGNLTSTADVSIAATTNAVVLAANTARRKAIISNLSANAREFRIGDAGAAAGEGMELLPGATIELETTAAIRAFNPHSAAQSLSVLEVLD